MTRFVKLVVFGLIVLIAATSPMFTSASSDASPSIAVPDESSTYFESAQKRLTSYIEEQLSLYGVEYFAYMDYDESSAELQPIILEARTRIIYDNSTGWVADGLDGCIKDEDGNVIEVLPHFHDLFPDDWELPPRYVIPDN